MKQIVHSFALVMVCIIAFSGTAFSADKVKDEKQDTEFKKRVTKIIYEVMPKISVKSYLEWQQKWGHDLNAFDSYRKWQSNAAKWGGDLVDPHKSNTFKVNRVYITLKKNFLNMFTARITTDVSTGAEGNYSNVLYLKYAYIQFKKTFGPIGIDSHFGKIGTPVIGLTDHLTDYRWLNNNYIDAAKVVLNNNSFDNSADYGADFSINIMKYATLKTAVVNGEGYKKDESNDNKAIYALVSITPYKGIYLNGFARWEVTAKYDHTGKKEQKCYYGYGAAYKTKLIKVGFNNFLLYKTHIGSTFSEWGYSATAGPTGYTITIDDIKIYPKYTQKFILFDAWVNINLGEVIKKVPLLLAARFVYGKQFLTHQANINATSQQSEFGKERSSILGACGIGWRFDKHFRVMVYYEHQRYFVKQNRAVAYYFDPNSHLGGSTANYYTGKKDPDDKQKIYIKTEVKI